MRTIPIYKKNYLIPISDVDFQKRLKPSSLLNYFQDTASFSVEHLDISVGQLGKNFGMAWVLTRIRLELAGLPMLNEEITIETWPQEIRKWELQRDFLIRGGSGEIIGRAISSWMVIDVDSRELKRTDALGIDFRPPGLESVIPGRLSKLGPLASPTRAYQKFVGYSDIDLNGHINNARYLDYALDCFSLDLHARYEIRSIEINYLLEAFPGDILLLDKDTSAAGERRILIEGCRESDGKTIFRCLIEIGETTE